MNIKMRTILITGGTGNLGIHLSRYFLENGDRVIVTSRVLENAEIAAKILNEESGKDNARGYALDLQSHISIEKFVAQIDDQNIVPDILINNAAVDNIDSIKDLSYSNLENILQTNCMGAVWLTKLISDIWLKARFPGCVLNVSSLLSIYGCKNSAAYAASKAALEAFSRCFSVEMGEHGIRCNTIRIAGMGGDLINQNEKSRVVSLDSEQKNNKNDFSKVPLKRPGHMQEFIDLVDFLVSGRAGYITGQSFNVDGGASVLYPAYSLPET